MPQNFPEIWLKRVIDRLSQEDKANFLEGIGELPYDVVSINPGTKTEKNKIYVPLDNFDVDVLLNNDSYPLPVQEFTDGTAEITLDKYQTKVTSLPDDMVLGASYDKIDAATKKHIKAITKFKHRRAIWKLAPASNTQDTPVLEATGDALPDGRKRLTYNDLVALKEKLDKLDWPLEGRRIVLSPEHWNDLLTDRERFADLLNDFKKGVQTQFLGFEFKQYTVMPLYDSNKNKKPFGAIAGTGDKVASVVFHVENVAKKTGFTRQYFVPSTLNPRGQSNELSYRHYFIVQPFRNKYLAAIV